MNWSYIWAGVALVAGALLAIWGVEIMTRPAMIPWLDRLGGFVMFIVGIGIVAVCVRAMTL